MSLNNASSLGGSEDLPRVVSGIDRAERDHEDQHDPVSTISESLGSLAPRPSDENDEQAHDQVIAEIDNLLDNIRSNEKNEVRESMEFDAMMGHKLADSLALEDDLDHSPLGVDAATEHGNAADDAVEADGALNDGVASSQAEDATDAPPVSSVTSGTLVFSDPGTEEPPAGLSPPNRSAPVPRDHEAADSLDGEATEPAPESVVSSTSDPIPPSDESADTAAEPAGPEPADPAPIITSDSADNDSAASEQVDAVPEEQPVHSASEQVDAVPEEQSVHSAGKVDGAAAAAEQKATEHDDSAEASALPRTPTLEEEEAPPTTSTGVSANNVRLNTRLSRRSPVESKETADEPVSSVGAAAESSSDAAPITDREHAEEAANPNGTSTAEVDEIDGAQTVETEAEEVTVDPDVEAAPVVSSDPAPERVRRPVADSTPTDASENAESNAAEEPVTSKQASVEETSLTEAGSADTETQPAETGSQGEPHLSSETVQSDPTPAESETGPEASEIEHQAPAQEVTEPPTSSKSGGDEVKTTVTPEAGETSLAASTENGSKNTVSTPDKPNHSTKTSSAPTLPGTSAKPKTAMRSQARRARGSSRPSVRGGGTTAPSGRKNPVGRARKTITRPRATADKPSSTADKPSSVSRRGGRRGPASTRGRTMPTAGGGVRRTPGRTSARQRAKTKNDPSEKENASGEKPKTFAVETSKSSEAPNSDKSESKQPEVSSTNAEETAAPVNQPPEKGSQDDDGFHTAPLKAATSPRHPTQDSRRVHSQAPSRKNAAPALPTVETADSTAPAPLKPVMSPRSQEQMWSRVQQRKATMEREKRSQKARGPGPFPSSTARSRGGPHRNPYKGGGVRSDAFRTSLRTEAGVARELHNEAFASQGGRPRWKGKQSVRQRAENQLKSRKAEARAKKVAADISLGRAHASPHGSPPVVLAKTTPVTNRTPRTQHTVVVRKTVRSKTPGKATGAAASGAGEQITSHEDPLKFVNKRVVVRKPRDVDLFAFMRALRANQVEWHQDVPQMPPSPAQTWDISRGLDTSFSAHVSSRMLADSTVKRKPATGHLAKTGRARNAKKRSGKQERIPFSRPRQHESTMQDKKARFLEYFNCHVHTANRGALARLRPQPTMNGSVTQICKPGSRKDLLVQLDLMKKIFMDATIGGHKRSGKLMCYWVLGVSPRFFPHNHHTQNGQNFDVSMKSAVTMGTMNQNLSKFARKQSAGCEFSVGATETQSVIEDEAKGETVNGVPGSDNSRMHLFLLPSGLVAEKSSREVAGLSANDVLRRVRRQEKAAHTQRQAQIGSTSTAGPEALYLERANHDSNAVRYLSTVTFKSAKPEDDRVAAQGDTAGGEPAGKLRCCDGEMTINRDFLVYVRGPQKSIPKQEAPLSEQNENGDGVDSGDAGQDDGSGTFLTAASSSGTTDSTVVKAEAKVQSSAGGQESSGAVAVLPYDLRKSHAFLGMPVTNARLQWLNLRTRMHNRSAKPHIPSGQAVITHISEDGNMVTASPAAAQPEDAYNIQVDVNKWKGAFGPQSERKEEEEAASVATVPAVDPVPARFVYTSPIQQQIDAPPSPSHPMERSHTAESQPTPVPDPVVMEHEAPPVASTMVPQPQPWQDASEPPAPQQRLQIGSVVGATAPNAGSPMVPEVSKSLKLIRSRPGYFTKSPPRASAPQPEASAPDEREAEHSDPPQPVVSEPSEMTETPEEAERHTEVDMPAVAEEAVDASAQPVVEKTPAEATEEEPLEAPAETYDQPLEAPSNEPPAEEATSEAFPESDPSLAQDAQGTGDNVPDDLPVPEPAEAMTAPEIAENIVETEKAGDPTADFHTSVDARTPQDAAPQESNAEGMQSPSRSSRVSRSGVQDAPVSTPPPSKSVEQSVKPSGDARSRSSNKAPRKSAGLGEMHFAKSSTAPRSKQQGSRRRRTPGTATKTATAVPKTRTPVRPTIRTSQPEVKRTTRSRPTRTRTTARTKPTTRTSARGTAGAPAASKPASRKRVPTRTRRTAPSKRTSGKPSNAAATPPACPPPPPSLFRDDSDSETLVGPPAPPPRPPQRTRTPPSTNDSSYIGAGLVISDQQTSSRSRTQRANSRTNKSHKTTSSSGGKQVISATTNSLTHAGSMGRRGSHSTTRRTPTTRSAGPSPATSRRGSKSRRSAEEQKSSVSKAKPQRTTAPSTPRSPSPTENQAAAPEKSEPSRPKVIGVSPLLRTEAPVRVVSLPVRQKSSRKKRNMRPAHAYFAKPAFEARTVEGTLRKQQEAQHVKSPYNANKPAPRVIKPPTARTRSPSEHRPPPSLGAVDGLRDALGNTILSTSPLGGANSEARIHARQTHTYAQLMEEEAASVSGAEEVEPRIINSPEVRPRATPPRRKGTHKIKNERPNVQGVSSVASSTARKSVTGGTGGYESALDARVNHKYRTRKRIGGGFKNAKATPTAAPRVSPLVSTGRQTPASRTPARSKTPRKPEKAPRRQRRAEGVLGYASPTYSSQQTFSKSPTASEKEEDTDVAVHSRHGGLLSAENTVVDACVRMPISALARVCRQFYCAPGAVQGEEKSAQWAAFASGNGLRVPVQDWRSVPESKMHGRTPSTVVRPRKRGTSLLQEVFPASNTDALAMLLPEEADETPVEEHKSPPKRRAMPLSTHGVLSGVKLSELPFPVTVTPFGLVVWLKRHCGHCHSQERGTGCVNMCGKSAPHPKQCDSCQVWSSTYNTIYKTVLAAHGHRFDLRAMVSGEASSASEECNCPRLGVLLSFLPQFNEDDDNTANKAVRNYLQG